MEKTIHTLELHEGMWTDNEDFWIFKVLSGWIYTPHDNGTFGPPVFVPFPDKYDN